MPICSKESVPNIQGEWIRGEIVYLDQKSVQCPVNISDIKRFTPEGCVVIAQRDRIVTYRGIPDILHPRTTTQIGLWRPIYLYIEGVNQIAGWELRLTSHIDNAVAEIQIKCSTSCGRPELLIYSSIEGGFDADNKEQRQTVYHTSLRRKHLDPQCIISDTNLPPCISGIWKVDNIIGINDASPCGTTSLSCIQTDVSFDVIIHQSGRIVTMYIPKTNITRIGIWMPFFIGTNIQWKFILSNVSDAAKATMQVSRYKQRNGYEIPVELDSCGVLSGNPSDVTQTTIKKIEDFSHYRCMQPN